MHSRRLEKLRVVLDDGRSIGQLRRIACAFSFRQSPEFFVHNIRTDSAIEPHGCLGDLGWYCIRFALWLMNWQMPLRVPHRVHGGESAEATSGGKRDVRQGLLS